MKKLLFLVLFLFFSFFFSSCSDKKSETEGKNCNPICKVWETCNDGSCELKKDMCSTSNDCKDGVNTVCNESHLCEKPKDNSCESACEELA